MAGNAVDAVFEAVGEALAKGEEVRIGGFGTFSTKSRSAGTGRNPQTSESLEIQASTAPTFKPGKALKLAVGQRASVLAARPLPADAETIGQAVWTARSLV